MEYERCTQEVREYVQAIEGRLRELEHQNFIAGEVTAFRSIMQAHATSLDEHVWTTCLDATISVTFLNAVMKQKLVHPFDHAEFRLVARTKAIAISNGGLKRTIWERWLYGGQQTLTGVPEHTAVEEALVFDAGNAREWLENKMETCLSAESANVIVKANLEELLKMDEFFFLEVAFLLDHFDGLMEEHMRSMMLEITPPPGERRVLSKAVAASRALSVGPVCMAQKKNIQSDMMNAANALLDISTSAAPSAQELAAMSCWMVMFHKRCENFQHVIMDGEDNSTGASSSGGFPPRRHGKHLHGHEALRYRHERCAKVMVGHQNEQDLKELRQFRWMLSDTELKEVEEWTRAKVVSSKDQIMQRKPEKKSALVRVQTSRSWWWLLLR